MATQFTPLGLPYPQIGDQPNVPADIQRLAEKADLLLTEVVSDSNWVTEFVPLEGYTSTETLNVRKEGSLVTLHTALAKTTGNFSAGYTKIGDLGVGYRPSKLIRTPITFGASTALVVGGLEITTGGVVNVIPVGSVSGSCFLFATFYVN